MLNLKSQCVQVGQFTSYKDDFYQSLGIKKYMIQELAH
jgi:hypothetical protein